MPFFFPKKKKTTKQSVQQQVLLTIRSSALNQPLISTFAKQLNVVTTQLGVDAKKIVMNIGSAAAGYGYEYVVSTMDRIKVQH